MATHKHIELREAWWSLALYMVLAGYKSRQTQQSRLPPVADIYIHYFTHLAQRHLVQQHRYRFTRILV